MATDYSTTDTDEERKRPSTLVRLLILAGLAFAGGAAAMGYVLTHWDRAVAFLAEPRPTVAPPPPTPLAVTVQRTPMTPEEQARIDRRVSELERRIAQINARADAAMGNADRAEGLLVAFAARRALDRAMALGYIEALLRERFGATQPRAVATIIAAGRNPATLEELEAGLSEIGPSLIGGNPEEHWWEGIRRELAGLVVVRKANTPSPDPADRLARAKRQLEAGHVGAALAEVARLPGRDAAAGWIREARRYAAARDALDMIETAALLEPHHGGPPRAPADARDTMER